MYRILLHKFITLQRFQLKLLLDEDLLPRYPATASALVGLHQNEKGLNETIEGVTATHNESEMWSCVHVNNERTGVVDYYRLTGACNPHPRFHCVWGLKYSKMS